MRDNTTTRPLNNIMLQEDSLWAMGCHLLGFLGSYIFPLGGLLGLVLIKVVKQELSPFIRFHLREALNFQLTLLVSIVSFIVIGGVLLLLTILFAFSNAWNLLFVAVGIPLMLMVIAVSLVFPIIAAIKAYQGEFYSYPFTISFVKS